MEPQELVQIGIVKGWIKPPANKTPIPSKERQRAYRDRLYAAGLTSERKPRRNKPRPELRGIKQSVDPLGYLRAWRRLQREAFYAEGLNSKGQPRKRAYSRK